MSATNNNFNILGIYGELCSHGTYHLSNVQFEPVVGSERIFSSSWIVIDKAIGPFIVHWIAKAYHQPTTGWWLSLPL